MIASVKLMMEHAYRSRRYRLAAAIAMLSEHGWYANDLNATELAIVEQAERLLSQPNLTRKAKAERKQVEPPPPDVAAEAQHQPQPKDEAQPRRFVRPAVEEVAAYCRERHNGVNAQQFVDFYEAKGWRIGKNPMKDWRAAVRTWEQRDGRAAQKDNRGGTPAPAEKIKLWD